MQELRKKFQFLPFIINITICLVFGAIGRYFTKKNVVKFYEVSGQHLGYPSLSITIKIIIIISILLGIAAFLIWQRRKEIKHYYTLIALYLSQFLIHLLWRITFINFTDYFISSFLMIALIILILTTSITFFRINKVAGLLTLPYLIWISYIGYLSYYLYFFN
ncbi:TspO/MBR family protein [Pedobacter flavus]|uniref:TspO/MBR family protein n=1 Tax=Pedobacter flavus TaxID=3113906 RepID=A0ABU7H1N7_9SPHI|nr:TspO/MBR family protein [Pedobacter sp. VNH31]MEE1885222.1 TspO/MBR family protein [Pedobacter sp. VNH31]